MYHTMLQSALFVIAAERENIIKLEIGYAHYTY